VKKGVRLCLALSMAVSLVVGSAVILGFDSVISLFTKDVEARTFAYQMMWYLAPFAWLFAVSDILGGAMRGSGAPVPVTIISAICICVFRVIWLSVLLHFFRDIRLVFLCYPVSWVLSSLVMSVYYFRFSTIRKTIKHHSLQASQ
jgi:Na+-driven multidrug efflux pump